MWGDWLHNPPRVADPRRFTAGDKSEVGHMWADWLHNPCCLGVSNASKLGQNQKWPTCGGIGYKSPARLADPQRFTMVDKIRSGPHVGGLAT